jgi:hypothetical protein
MARTARLVLGAMLALTAAFPMVSNAQSGRSNTQSFALYVMTNSAEKNEVISFTPNPDGQLQEFHRFPTTWLGALPPSSPGNPCSPFVRADISELHSWPSTLSAKNISQAYAPEIDLVLRVPRRETRAARRRRRGGGRYEQKNQRLSLGKTFSAAHAAK